MHQSSWTTQVRSCVHLPSSRFRSYIPSSSIAIKNRRTIGGRILSWSPTRRCHLHQPLSHRHPSLSRRLNLDLRQCACCWQSERVTRSQNRRRRSQRFPTSWKSLSAAWIISSTRNACVCSLTFTYQSTIKKLINLRQSWRRWSYTMKERAELLLKIMNFANSWPSTNKTFKSKTDWLGNSRVNWLMQTIRKTNLDASKAVRFVRIAVRLL